MFNPNLSIIDPLQALRSFISSSICIGDAHAEALLWMHMHASWVILNVYHSNNCRIGQMYNQDTACDLTYFCQSRCGTVISPLQLLRQQ